ncbi:MAG: GTP-binding protein, partial [Candidatus Cloacimonetes bacterium]|nr:GTP-binding protein [Candidatus Cloacimonadota bacterium]
LSDEKREQLKGVYDNLVPHSADITKILKLLKTNWVGKAKSKIAIVGPANVGKSTIYNLFLIDKEEEAVVSPVPGATRENQESNNLIFNLIDTPGADAVGAVGEVERKKAFEALELADFVIIVFEATRGVKQTEQDLFQEIKTAMKNKPYLIVCNKIDLHPKKEDQTKIIQSMAENLSIKESQIIPISAIKGQNFDKLVLGITKLSPEFIEAISQALPQYQNKLCWQRISVAAVSCGVIALTPIPLSDILPILAIQTGMTASIARIYGVDFNLKLAGEAAALFGSGFLARALYQTLSKAGGVPGWILSASIAVAATAAIGKAAQQWFEYGEAPTKEWIENQSKTFFKEVYRFLLDTWKKKPRIKEFREILSNNLERLMRNRDNEKTTDI